MKKRAILSILAATAVVAAVAAWKSPSAIASSHREAPGILSTPQVDGTDFYMFRSYEPGRDGFVTLIANYQPLQDPYGGPNYFSMDPNALYEIHIDNDGATPIREDITFRFRFSNTSPFLSIPVGGTNVAVPLVNIGPLGGPSGLDALNIRRTYTVQVIRGGLDNPSSINTITNKGTGATSFGMPFDNIGRKSIPDYTAYADQFIHDIVIPGCEDGRMFVGQRKDPFVVNLGEVFDLINLNPVGNPDAERNALADKNITSFILEVPIDCLTEDKGDVIGSWTTARLPRARTLRNDPTFDNPDVVSSDFVQVSRLGMPLVNELVIGLGDKNKFNASHPRNDSTNFGRYITNPTLPELIEILFGVDAPSNFPRNDLIKTFVTGLPGVNELGIGEMQRLNTAVPPTPIGQQNRLGAVGGDFAGFPNGRRLGDDVVDIELRVVMGLLCHIPDPNAPPTQGTYNATLNGQSVVPPVPTTTTGTCVGGLNGNNFFATCNHNVQNVIRGSFRLGAVGQEGAEICRDATGPIPVVFSNCTLNSSQLQALNNGATYIELSTINNPNGHIRGQVIPPAPPSLGMCTAGNAPAGDLPFTDGAFQQDLQFDDAFPYLTTPIPGSPNNRTSRSANLIGQNLDLPADTADRGFAELVLEDEIFSLFFRTNLTPPYTMNVTQDGPNGPALFSVEVNDTGPQQVTLDESDFLGAGSFEIFADGFESGDTSSWSTATQPKSKGATAAIIAGPLR